MSELHNLKDYKFAKKMTEEIPSAVTALEETYSRLQQYKNFNSVKALLDNIERTIVALGSNLPYFENIVKSKGGQVD